MVTISDKQIGNELIGSACSKVKIIEVINEFYCSDKCNLVQKVGNVGRNTDYSVFNGMIECPGVCVTKKGNRWRFELVDMT